MLFLIPYLQLCIPDFLALLIFRYALGFGILLPFTERFRLRCRLLTGYPEQIAGD